MTHKDALESIPCEVYSMDHVKEVTMRDVMNDALRLTGCGDPDVKILSRDNVHTWARENGGPIEITDEMVQAGWLAVSGHAIFEGNTDESIRNIYAAMEAKRREGK